MKKMFIILLSFVLIGCSSNNLDIYSEECRVIRNNNKIVGIKYIITINDTDLEEISVIPKIYDSINHFIDINNISNLDIYLELHNNSKYDYVLENIYFNNSKKYNYNKIIYRDKIDVIYYSLDNHFFNKYRDGFKYEIIFSKRTRKF